MIYKNIIKLLLITVVLPSYANTTTYSCNYPIYTDEEGVHKVTRKFELNFIFDDKAKKSYMLGNNGSTEVGRFKYAEHIVFAEITSFGSFMTTTIDKNLNSVHSRNTVMSGKLIASQFFGKCVVK